MTEYYATCDVQGPISVRIEASSLDEVLECIKLKGRSWIDDFRSDAEESFIDPELEDDWSEYTPEDIDKVMQEVGYQCVHDIRIQGYWKIWKEI